MRTNGSELGLQTAGHAAIEGKYREINVLNRTGGLRPARDLGSPCRKGGRNCRGTHIAPIGPRPIIK
jgi:hypothetical protein